MSKPCTTLKCTLSYTFSKNVIFILDREYSNLMSDDSNEVKCPHCKKAFKIDQSGYTNILQQIRDVESVSYTHLRAHET